MIVKAGNLGFDVTKCSSFFSQARGLMFKRLINDGLLFIFDEDLRIDLHMLFVFYTIDIVFIDSEFKVIKVLRKVKPFRLFVKGVKCKYILELKDCKGLKVNDKVSFKYNN